MNPRIKIKNKISEIISFNKDDINYIVLDSNRVIQLELENLPAVIVHFQNENILSELVTSPGLVLQREITFILKCLHTGTFEQLENLAYIVEKKIMAADIIPKDEESLYSKINLKSIDFDYNGESESEIKTANIEIGVLYENEPEYEDLPDLHGIDVNFSSNGVSQSYNIN